MAAGIMQQTVNYDVVNWQGRKLPAGLDMPDKTIFMAPEFPSHFANLIMYPLETDPKQHLNQVAAALGMDAYSLRGRLSGRGYMALKRSPEVKEIASCVQVLNKSGYRARMIKDDTFFRVPAPRRVVGMEWSPNAVQFQLTGDVAPLAIARNEPVFCVLADLDSTRNMATVREKDAAAAPPPAQNFSFRALMDRTRIYHCDIFVPYRWLAVRVVTDRFSFACLGKQATEFSAENLAILLDRLAAFPLNLVWDDRYPETALFGLKAQIERATSEQMGASFGDTDTRVAPFNYYTRFRYILELANSFKCFL